MNNMLPLFCFKIKSCETAERIPIRSVISNFTVVFEALHLLIQMIYAILLHIRRHVSSTGTWRINC